MKRIAKWIVEVIHMVKDYQLPEAKDKRGEYIKKFEKDIAKNEAVKRIKREIKQLCKKFPIPSIN